MLLIKRLDFYYWEDRPINYWKDWHYWGYWMFASEKTVPLIMRTLTLQMKPLTLYQREVWAFAIEEDWSYNDEKNFTLCTKEETDSSPTRRLTK